MNKRVLILGIGDVYWTRFALRFSRLLHDAGIPSVIALESRVGEYQAFWRRCNYHGTKVYYLTDFINSTSVSQDSNCDPRVVMSDYLRVKMLGQKGKLFNTDWGRVAKQVDDFTRYVFESENIALVISEQVATSFSHAFCKAAAEKGIEYWGLCGSRLAGRYAIETTVASEALRVKAFYDEIVRGHKPLSTAEQTWGIDYITEIDSQVPDYMRSPILNTISPGKFLKKRYLKSLIGSFIYSLLERADRQAIVIKASPLVTISTAISRSTARWYRAKLARKYFDRDTARALGSSPYFVYPVHYQPEASTIVASPYYADQLNLITNLAFSMPSGVKLVVKEHVSNVGFPSLAFYRALKSLPNVVLVWHTHSIKELIRKSRGVITLTSTAGFEALLLNKHVYHFGDVFYTFHPNAIRLDDWSSVRQILVEEPRPAHYDNVAFSIAYRRYTHEGRLDTTKEDFGIADLLVEKVKCFIGSSRLKAVV